jgi:enamine deaminase RidA (YjgF/YER057c/UK114 family)
MEMKFTGLRVLTAGLLLVAGTLLGAGSGEKGGDRRYIVLPGRAAPLMFSDGVLAGNTLYLAGRIGLDPKTRRPPESAEEEAKIALEGIRATLAEAGMTMDDVVFMEVHCPDVALYDRFNSVYRSYFGQNVPARAFLGSGPLLFGARFEILGIAVKR